MKPNLRSIAFVLLCLTVFNAHALDPSSVELSGLKIGMTKDQAIANFSTPGFKFDRAYGKDPQGPEEMIWKGPNNETVSAKFAGVPRKIYRVKRDAPRIKIGSEFQSIYDPQSICDSLVKKYGKPTHEIRSTEKTGFSCNVDWNFIAGSFSTSHLESLDCYNNTDTPSTSGKCTFHMAGNARKQLWSLLMVSPYHYGIYIKEFRDDREKKRQINQQIMPKATTPTF